MMHLCYQYVRYVYVQVTFAFWLPLDFKVVSVIFPNSHRAWRGRAGLRETHEGGGEGVGGTEWWGGWKYARRAYIDGASLLLAYRIRLRVGYACVFVASWFQRRFCDELSEFPLVGDRGGGERVARKENWCWRSLLVQQPCYGSRSSRILRAPNISNRDWMP